MNLNKDELKYLEGLKDLMQNKKEFTGLTAEEQNLVLSSFYDIKCNILYKFPKTLAREILIDAINNFTRQCFRE